MPQIKYPEHAKLALIGDKSQPIGDFLDWLYSMRPSGVRICEWREEVPMGEPGWEEGLEGWYPISMSTNDILAQFFGIDQGKIDAEKEQMLQEIRDTNKARMESKTEVVQPGE